MGATEQDFTTYPSFLDHDDTMVNITKQTSKQLYYTIIHFRKPSVSSQMKWNDVFPLGADACHDYWTEIYKRPYSSARDTKLQAFQYRISHRIIPCNKFLKNIRIRDDDKCSYCQDQDSIQHFLFLCPMTKTFWDKICQWFFKETDLQLDMSMRSYLFGVAVNRPQDKVVNFLLLFLKFYI